MVLHIVSDDRREWAVEALCMLVDMAKKVGEVAVFEYKWYYQYRRPFL